MSGVQKFVGNRTNPVQDVAEFQGVDSWLNRMGMKPSVMVPMTGPGNEPGSRPLSRQAIADHARVPSPAFRLPRNGSHARAAPLQLEPTGQATLAARPRTNRGRSSERYPQSEGKALGAFDTDTEKLDDTTSLGALDPSAEFPMKLEAPPETVGHPRHLNPNQPASRAARNPRSEFSSRGPASLASEEYAETNADHDGDDEFDDPSQYHDYTLDNKAFAHYHTGPRNDESQSAGNFNQPPYFPNTSQNLIKAETAPMSQRFHENHLKGAPYTYSSEDASEEIQTKTQEPQSGNPVPFADLRS
ncbi:MAG: hypothetical protein Q9219_001128 [cf. Caloplaca sp. 3 TL-2023]